MKGMHAKSDVLGGRPSAGIGQEQYLLKKTLWVSRSHARDNTLQLEPRANGVPIAIPVRGGKTNRPGDATATATHDVPHAIVLFSLLNIRDLTQSLGIILR